MTAGRRVEARVDDEHTAALRTEVRAFLADALRAGHYRPVVNGWMSGWDLEFSQRLAAAGYIGMTIPEQYGGRGRSFLERFVVNEELLAAGAPVAAHWFADRQVAPALLAAGSPAQKAQLLPRIAAATTTFAIGMSEPDSGSDLASVATRAEPVDGGWRLRGTKVWTSGAHRADCILLIARTTPRDPAARHDGLSQFLLRLDTPGVMVRPIISMDGRHHFNEVILDDVLVPPDAVLGVVGRGWQQVTAELGYERSGPERYLSTHLLLEDWAAATRGGRDHAELGRFVGRMRALHALSMGVAQAFSSGLDATTSAGMVKMLGTTTEGDLVEHLAHTDQITDAAARDRLHEALLLRAGFTLRGGTNEILRGVAAREVGLR